MSVRPVNNDGARQRGVALITVLLVLALSTALVVRAAERNQLWLRQVDNAAALARTVQVQRAAQVWVGLLLERDNNEFDGATDPWALELPPIPAGDSTLIGAVIDLQGRFNVNKLVNADGEADAQAIAAFTRLLELLDLRPGIAEAVLDWIDADDLSSGAWGAESDHYAALDPAYACANRPVMDTAELRLVRGVDPETWRKLEPFVTALPEPVAVNVNSARPELLAAVMTGRGPPQIVLEEARYWAADLRRDPARRVAEFVQRIGGRGEAPAEGTLSVRSEYFLARIGVRTGNAEQWSATRYRRDAAGRVRVLSHAQLFAEP